MNTKIKLGCFLLWVTLGGCSSNEVHGKKEFPELYAKYPEVPVFDGDLYVVFAHADDELLSFGYVAHVRRLYPEKPIHWILVTDSGEGFVLPFTCDEKDPAKCRSQEAVASAKCVGIAEPYEMHLRDGELKKYKDIDARIFAVMQKLKKNKIGAVLTSDNTGVYGHPDHLVVHDSMRRLAKKHDWKVISNALPAIFREKIKLKKEAEQRVDLPITHVIELDAELREKMVCATKAHESQKLILWLMNQMQSPEDFAEKVPRQFFNVTDY